MKELLVHQVMLDLRVKVDHQEIKEILDLMDLKDLKVSKDQLDKLEILAMLEILDQEEVKDPKEMLVEQGVKVIEEWQEMQEIL